MMAGVAVSLARGADASMDKHDRGAGPGYESVPVPSMERVAMPTSDLVIPRRTIVVMGVAGSGKSVCGAALARAAGIDFVDGDALHPAANVTKMSGGHALSDEDRWPWLDRVGAVLADCRAHPQGVVIACSALRRRYRDRIRAGASPSAPVFVFIDITPEVARVRLANRPGHFMPASLVDSQFETLERPGSDERDVLTIEETGGVAATVQTAIDALRTMPRP